MQKPQSDVTTRLNNLQFPSAFCHCFFRHSQEHTFFCTVLGAFVARVPLSVHSILAGQGVDRRTSTRVESEAVFGQLWEQVMPCTCHSVSLYNQDCYTQDISISLSMTYNNLCHG